MRQECSHFADRRVDVDLVLPLELRPHGAEGQLADPGPLDVVQDVHVELVQHRALLVGRALFLVCDVPEYDACLGARDLDRRVHHHLLARCQCHSCRPVHQLQIALRAELDQNVLQGVLRAVDHHELEHEVEGVNLQERLHVHGVRQARHLLHLRQALREERAVGGRLARDRGAARRVEVVVVVDGAPCRACALPLAELAEDDALVRADALFLDLGLLAQRPLGVLRGELQDAGELRPPAAGRPLGLHQLRGGQVVLRQGTSAVAHQQPDALRQAHSAVGALPATRVLPHQLEQVDQHEEHLVTDRRVQTLRLQDELGHGDADHRREKEIPPEQQRPQLGLLAARGLLGRLDLLLALLPLVHILRAVCAVRQHHRPRGDPGGGRGGGLLLALPGGPTDGVLLVLALVSNQGQWPQAPEQGLQHSIDKLLLFDILTEKPQATSQHAGLLHLDQALRQALENGHPQIRIIGDQLAQEHDHLRGGRLVGLRQELHEQEHDTLRLVGVLPCASMERADEQAAILQVPLDALRLVAKGLRHLFLEQRHDILDVPRTDQAAKANVHDLFAHVERRARQGTEYVHDHALHDLLVVLLDLLQSVQDYQLHVVVGLLCEQRDVRLGGLVDRDRRRRQRDKRRGAVVGHRRRRGRGQVEHDAEEASLVRGAGAADLAH
mmetsp:Transcript_60458/g.184696  ORF Transcript_60458/g.184696 Transcript_60458/m.184696 type:complete len:668 (+) Transcript_60458:444-2447(+)